MLRYLGLLTLPLLLLVTPASALTAKQKMETCKIGATAEKLTGAKRKAFIRKCMARGNYEPAARKAAMKKKAGHEETSSKKNRNPPTPNKRSNSRRTPE